MIWNKLKSMPLKEPPQTPFYPPKCYLKKQKNKNKNKNKNKKKNT